MINIHLKELNVFSYDATNLSIGIWQEGNSFRLIGNIIFTDLKQAEHFAKMINRMSEESEK